MYENLIEFFLLQPSRLIALGRALFQLSTMVLIAGLCGRITVAAAAAIQGIGGHKTTDIALATLYPSLPTWWVPENAAAYGLCIATAVAGLLLSHYGKTLDRLTAH
jgi:hypothetical protein